MSWNLSLSSSNSFVLWLLVEFCMGISVPSDCPRKKKLVYEFVLQHKAKYENHTSVFRFMDRRRHKKAQNECKTYYWCYITINTVNIGSSVSIIMNPIKKKHSYHELNCTYYLNGWILWGYFLGFFMTYKTPFSVSCCLKAKPDT